MADILKMFNVVIKALFRKSACGMYPKKPAHSYPNSRGHIDIEKEKCILCTLCQKRCPTGAIHVDRNAKKWAINHYKCIYCNNCVEVCPPKCLHMIVPYSAPETTKDIVTIDIPFVIKKKPPVKENPKPE
jgi:formate hydrogenlyase subunit 6/NADH:ubiquinone oxidoreductase subunit I